jgi:hypothetical protein
MIVLTEFHSAASIPLYGAARSCMIDQNLSHYMGSDPQEVCAAGNLSGFLTDEAQIRFVNQSGALQSVVVPLATELTLCEPVQFLVHDRDQGLQCRGVTRLPPGQQRCYGLGSLQFTWTRRIVVECHCDFLQIA